MLVYEKSSSYYHGYDKWHQSQQVGDLPEGQQNPSSVDSASRYASTLLLTISDTSFHIPDLVLRQWFDEYGNIEMIYTLPVRESFEALVRFQNPLSAKFAKSGLDGKEVFCGIWRLGVQLMSKDFLDKADIYCDMYEDPFDSMKLRFVFIDLLLDSMCMDEATSTYKVPYEGVETELLSKDEDLVVDAEKVFDEFPMKDFMKPTLKIISPQVLDEMPMNEIDVTQAELGEKSTGRVFDKSPIVKISEEYLEFHVCTEMVMEPRNLRGNISSFNSKGTVMYPLFDPGGGIYSWEPNDKSESYLFNVSHVEVNETEDELGRVLREKKAIEEDKNIEVVEWRELEDAEQNVIILQYEDQKLCGYVGELESGLVIQKTNEFVPDGDTILLVNEAGVEMMVDGNNSASSVVSQQVVEDETVAESSLGCEAELQSGSVNQHMDDVRVLNNVNGIISELMVPGLFYCLNFHRDEMKSGVSSANMIVINERVRSLYHYFEKFVLLAAALSLKGNTVALINCIESILCTRRYTLETGVEIMHSGEKMETKGITKHVFMEETWEFLPSHHCVKIKSFSFFKMGVDKYELSECETSCCEWLIIYAHQKEGGNYFYVYLCVANPSSLDTRLLENKLAIFRECGYGNNSHRDLTFSKCCDIAKGVHDAVFEPGGCVGVAITGLVFFVRVFARNVRLKHSIFGVSLAPGNRIKGVARLVDAENHISYFIEASIIVFNDRRRIFSAK